MINSKPEKYIMQNSCISSIYNIMFINSIGTIYTTDLLDYLETTKYYRYNIKKTMNIIERELKEYYNIVKKRISDKDAYSFSQNASVIINKYIEEDVNKLYNSIRLEIGKYKGCDCEIFSHIWMCIFILQMTINVVDNWVEYFNNKKIEIKPKIFFDAFKTLEPLRLTNIYLNVIRISDFIYKGDEVINLNNSKNCLIGAKIIINKLCDKDFIKKAMEETRLLK